MGNVISTGFCGVCVLAFVSSSCGNGWLNAGARETTQVALIEKGDKAFGDKDYTTAALHYEQALSQEASNEKVRVKLAFTYNSMAGLSVLDIAKRAIKETSNNSNKSDEGGFDISSIQTILGLEGDFDCTQATSFENIRTETSESCDVPEESYLTKTTLQATTDQQLAALQKQLELYHKTYKIMCPTLNGTLSTLFEGQEDFYKTSYSGSDCNQGLPANSSFLGKFALSLALMTEASILYSSVITPLLDGVTTVNTKLASFNNPECDGGPCGNAAEEAVAKTKAFTELLDVATPLMSSLDADTLDVTIKNFELVSSLLSGDAEFVKEMDLSSSVKKAKESLNDIKAVVQSDSPSDIDNSTEEGKKAEQLQEARQKVKKQLLGENAEDVPATEAGGAVDSQFQEYQENSDDKSQEEINAKNCEMQSVCKNWDSMGPLMYPGQDISEEPESCENEEVTNAECSDSKTFLSLDSPPETKEPTSLHLTPYPPSPVKSGIAQFFQSIAENFKSLHKDL